MKRKTTFIPQRTQHNKKRKSNHFSDPKLVPLPQFSLVTFDPTYVVIRYSETTAALFRDLAVEEKTPLLASLQAFQIMARTIQDDPSLIHSRTLGLFHHSRSVY